MTTSKQIARNNKPTRAAILKAAVAATRKFIAAQRELNSKHEELWRLAKRHHLNLSAFEELMQKLVEQA